MRVGTTVDEAERLLILRTLEATGQNKTRAAEILGVSLKTLHNKLKEYSRERHDNRELRRSLQCAESLRILPRIWTESFVDTSQVSKLALTES